MEQQKRRRSWVGAVIVVVVSAATVGWAQGAGTEAPGSLAALIAEVKQLRLAVEASSRVQTQTQAVSVYLSAQQSRMVHLGQQLAEVQRELPGAAMRRQQAATFAASAQAELADPSDASEHAGRTEMARLFRDQADQAATHEQQLRQREVAIRQALQQEEARWAELIGRLDALTRGGR